MKRLSLLFVLLSAASHAIAQEPQKIKGPDERYKVDILVVVAHPDDEGAVTPYLARAIYDLHKSVAVVFGTRGGSGGNDYRREHGPAMADVREIEARQACAKLGIDKVWFLGGKDTASQNVLNSLANWGHGQSLEEMVRIVRLTRPEIIITWLPSIFIGENHGDHQAAGVLATEAFDLAADPTAFPAQLAGASKRLEPYLENLTPWQPKKIYYFSDASDSKRFMGTGPAYSVKEISPSQKKPYYRLAIDAALPHLTQFPEDIERMAKLSDADLEKLMNDPHSAWWNEPDTLIFGKTVNPGPTVAAGDVFAGIVTGEAINGEPSRRQLASVLPMSEQPQLYLGGPWLFYKEFRQAHWILGLPQPAKPEIAVKSGSLLYVPLVVLHGGKTPEEVTLKVTAPDGWKVISGEGRLLLPAERQTALRVEIQTPELSVEALKNVKPQTVSVRLVVAGKDAGLVDLNVLLGHSGLPQ
ncbi:MAG TPA: PIG-L family deacetylase [Candidatus Acidoferrum sp.]|nr:PIG-L family deacetylase [Candidatus Acidoferrum sp.]